MKPATSVKPDAPSKKGEPVAPELVERFNKAGQLGAEGKNQEALGAFGKALALQLALKLDGRYL